MALGQGELRDGTGRWCRAAHPTVCGLGCHWAMDGAGAAHSHLIFSSVVTSSARIRLPMLSTWSGLGLGLGLGSGSVVSGKGQG